MRVFPASVLPWLLLALLATPAAVFAAAPPAAPLPPAAQAWLEEIRRQCREDHGAQLKVDWQQVLAVAEVTGDGVNDIILTHSPEAMTCGGRPTRGWCGTLGCPMLVVVNGATPVELMVRGSWRLGRLQDGRPALLIGTNWQACGFRPDCHRLLVWDAASRTFRQLGTFWQHEPQEPEP